ncbi:hypothetical protein GF340_01210 [Candidatus Peregrinibacteria bacterium]|nr:hypothetical protein [Candidatus Peregrinibacteria bacterium]
MKKGFSAVAAILIVVLVIMAGATGFAYYKYTTDPDFEFYGLIPREVFMKVQPKSNILPESLLPYVKGTDASIIFSYKKTEDVSKKIAEYQEKLESEITDEFDFTKVESILFVAKGPLSLDAAPETGSGIYAMEVSDEEMAKKLYDEAIAADQEGLVVERNGNILTGRFGDEMLEGDLRKNPIFASVKGEYGNAEIAFLAKPVDVKELGPLVYSGAALFGSGFGNLGGSSGFGNLESNATPLLPLAHAQGFISPSDNPARISDATVGGDDFANASTNIEAVIQILFAGPYMGLFVDLDESVLNANMEYQFADYETYYSTYYEDAEIEGVDIPKEETKQIYEMVTSGVNVLINDPDMPEEVEATFEDSLLSVDIEIDLEGAASDLIDAQIEAPARARDAARKADLNILVAAVEMHSADNDSYPAQSACIEDMDLIDDYMPGRVVGDPMGPQTFGATECEKGYYYSAPTADYDGYALWAASEIEETGNIDAFTEDPSEIETKNGGKYFVINNYIGKSADSDAPVLVEPYEVKSADEPVKVKRVSR